MILGGPRSTRTSYPSATRREAPVAPPEPSLPKALGEQALNDHEPSPSELGNEPGANLNDVHADAQQPESSAQPTEVPVDFKPTTEVEIPVRVVNTK